MKEPLTVADFFCGAGGFSEGFRQAGFKIVFALDNWDPARQTHKLNHPDCKHPGLDCFFETNGDILNIHPDRINEIVDDTDVIIGSPPCFPFSSSNRAGKGDKSLGIELIKKYLQIIAVKKHMPHSRLKYWLMENVPNSRKHINDEYTFRNLGLTNDILRKLKINKDQNDIALKIDKSEECLYNSVLYGVPQRRERFVCGEYQKPEKRTINPKEWITLGDVIVALKNKSTIDDPNYHLSIDRKELTDHFYTTTIPRFEWEEAKIKKQQARFYGKMSFPEDLSVPSRTVMATRSVLSRESMILPNGAIGKFRAPTVREVACLMSFPITYLFQGMNEATKYRLVGNAVCPKLSYAFAEAILKSRKIDPKYIPDPKSDRKKLILDLRESPPPKKKPRDKHPSANFAEIVPDLKYRNFRVEIDNNFPRENGNKVRWISSLHHATGAGSMKKAFVPSKTLKKIFNQYHDKKRIQDFISAVNKTFQGRIPNAQKFQQQHSLANPDYRFFTPRQSLRATKKLIDKFFPENQFNSIHLDNFQGKKAIIKFDNGELPENAIPIRMVAGLLACNHIVDMTKNKNS